MNKFSFLLAALCVSLHAQDAKPADAKPAAPAPEVKLSGGAKADTKQNVYQKEVLTLKGVQEISQFDRFIQIIKSQQEDLQRQQVYLENALTTPEKEARGHAIAAAQAKFKGDIESLMKIMNGAPVDRYQGMIPTKLLVAAEVSNEQLTKLSGEKDFKPESILALGEKKYLVKNTVSGQDESSNLRKIFLQIIEAKSRLQQSVEAQPSLTNDEDKENVGKNIKALQDLIAKKLPEFAKLAGTEFSNDLLLQAAEAKVIILITEEEKKAIEAKNAPAAPAADKK
jgi:hypothetical protein